MELNFTNLFLTFLAGLTSVANPCVLPVLPIIMTGTKEDHRLRPVLIVVGLTVTFIVMGIVTTLFSSLIAGRILYIEKVVGIIVGIFGALMLFEVNPFMHLSFANRLQFHAKGRYSGLILGLSLGVIWIPCIGPILSGVLGLVAVQGKLAQGIFLLLVYSAGFSIPMLIAGYVSQAFRQKLVSVGNHPLLVRFISGTILIAFGVYIYLFGLIGFGW